MESGKIQSRHILKEWCSRLIDQCTHLDLKNLTQLIKFHSALLNDIQGADGGMSCGCPWQLISGPCCFAKCIKAPLSHLLGISQALKCGLMGNRILFTHSLKRWSGLFLCGAVSPPPPPSSLTDWLEVRCVTQCEQLTTRAVLVGGWWPLVNRIKAKKRPEAKGRNCRNCHIPLCGSKGSLSYWWGFHQTWYEQTLEWYRCTVRRLYNGELLPRLKFFLLGQINERGSKKSYSPHFGGVWTSFKKSV